jgi:enediyne biosynthesis protein E4
MNTRTLCAFALLGFGCSSPPPAPPATEVIPTAETPTPKPDPPAPSTGLRFEDRAGDWGVRFTQHAGRHTDRWMPETMGSGLAIIDVNRDGAPDLLFTDSGSLAGDATPDVGPRLFLGDGKGAFSDQTQAWGLTHAGYGMGIAAADVDNDGWIDIYLTTSDGKNRLLRNDAGTGFVDVTATWGAQTTAWTTSAAFLDLERDGDLDLYVASYVTYSVEDALKCWFRSIHIYCTPALFDAQPDLLLRNDGGRFTDISDRIAGSFGKGLALATGDLDADGDTDIYVANDITRNLLWLNDGSGGLAESGQLAGVAYSELGREEASMGVGVADYNGDGHQDLAVTNLQGESTNLYAGGASGLYRERSDAAGVAITARARLAFGVEFLDGDNDGDEELLTANGHVSDNVGDYRDGVSFPQRNSLYENLGAGQMLDVTAGAGPALASVEVSRGLAVGDLNGDGGLDFVFVNNEGAAQVGGNATPNRGHWLILWLEGVTANRSAIGAIVTARIGEQTITREVRGASSYLSVSDRRLHLGLGDAGSVDSLTVTWPGGDPQTFQDVAGDRHLRLVQGGTPVPFTPGATVIAP